MTSKTPSTPPPKTVNKCPLVLTGELPTRPKAPALSLGDTVFAEWYGTVLLPWQFELERRFREGQELCKKY